MSVGKQPHKAGPFLLAALLERLHVWNSGALYV